MVTSNTAAVRIYSFSREAGHHIDRFGSDFILSPLTDPEGSARAAYFHLAPGGLVAEHPAVTAQLFCVVTGEGWVSGGEGVRKSLIAEQAAYWEPGEVHAAGTEDGMTAIVLEGDSFKVWAQALEDQ